MHAVECAKYRSIPRLSNYEYGGLLADVSQVKTSFALTHYLSWVHFGARPVELIIKSGNISYKCNNIVFDQWPNST